MAPAYPLFLLYIFCCKFRHRRISIVYPFMRTWLVISIFAIFALSAQFVCAQSRRNPTQTDGKANNRRPEATVTPSPSPSPAEAPANSVGGVVDSDVIKVTTQLVSVPVRVMDKKGRFIDGLKKEDFKVFEDGSEQEIGFFAGEEEPFTVALVLDMSYSTTFKIAEIQQAAIEFIDQLRPQDKVMVVSFDADVHVLCDPTADRKEIHRAIRSTKILTGTSLYEALDLVMNKLLSKIDGRKAIILFTDGVDTTSRRSNDLTNLNDAMELDALIYPIRYDTFADVQSMKNKSQIPVPPTVTNPGADGGVLSTIMRGVVKPSSTGTTEEEYRKAADYLDQLAIRTGGRIYEAKTLGNLAEAYSRIASELREFYSIGYYPKSDRVEGKRSNVKVKVARDGVVVRAREEYIRRKESK